MLDTKSKMYIFDDTGRGDDFDVIKILFEDDDIFVAEVENEWYDKPLKVMVNKESKSVLHNELRFYLITNK